MEQDFIEILKLVITILIAFITAFFTNKNERKKQTTVFFKQEGIKEQKKNFRFLVFNIIYGLRINNKKIYKR